MGVCVCVCVCVCLSVCLFRVATLFVAECVMSYLPGDTGTALIEMSSAMFEKVCFLAYDPISASDSFGSLMLMNVEVCSSFLSDFSVPLTILYLAKRVSHVGPA